MHVLIDGVHIVPQLKGIGRYALHTLNQLLALDGSLEFSMVLLEGSPCEGLPQNRRVRYFPVPWHNHLWHGFRTLPRWVRRLRPDVVYVPYETAMSGVSRPYTIVCHDIPGRIREAQKRGSGSSSAVSDRAYYWMDDLLLGKTLRGARRVFSNSRHVAEWLQKRVGVDTSKIAHAPCAPGADFFRLSQEVEVTSVRQRLDSPRGYILVLYTGDLRENFAVVPEIYQKIIGDGFPLTLVIAGVRDEARAFVESSLSGVPWRDRVRIVPFLESGREKELAEIYTAASVYLDPSLQEGFGMQVIEAMACGTPVICSDRGALPEVTGEAALLVNPEDPAEMASAVSRVLSSEPLQQQLRLRGYQRSASFSWTDTAKVIYRGLLEAAGGSPS